MTESHDDEQISGSPYHAEHDLYLVDAFRHLTVRARSTSASSHADQYGQIPDPEHNGYFNRQTVMVNGGLMFSGTTESGAGYTSNIDFSRFNAPDQVSLMTPTPPSTADLVQTLLHPPAHAFCHGYLSLQWVIGALGHRHFVFRETDERYVLRHDSSVRKDREDLGLPMALMEWLCGCDEHSSPTEQGMLLTKESFGPSE